MELGSRIKRYFKFSSKEIVGLIAAVLITAFIVSFKEWGIDTFDAYYGLMNLMNSVIIVGVVLLVKISIEKKVSSTIERSCCARRSPIISTDWK